MSTQDEKLELMRKVAEEKGNIQGNQRDREVRYMLWIDKILMKQLKFRALTDEKSVKQIIEEAVRLHLKEF